MKGERQRLKPLLQRLFIHHVPIRRAAQGVDHLLDDIHANAGLGLLRAGAQVRRVQHVGQADGLPGGSF